MNKPLRREPLFEQLTKEQLVDELVCCSEDHQAVGKLWHDALVEIEALKADRDRLRDCLIEVRKWCDDDGEVSRLIDEALAARGTKGETNG